MKNLTLITVLLLFAVSSYAQKITRGPDVGEFYFLGPTTTLLQGAIYRSTDFGETAICMDSVSALSYTIDGIAADKVTGGLYFNTMGEALYYSSNYGQNGSWEFKNSFITNPIRSGVSEGNIYKHIASHSEDFGENFITHSVNGIFGLIVDSEIDSNDGVGYCLTQNMIYTDTLYVFLTYDKYENLELVSSVNRFEQPLRYLSRGINTGELYTFIDFENSMLRFSNDFGNSWETKNNLYFNNYATVDFTGGRQSGEVYFLVTYLQLMGQIKHIFIYHSLDYGETFAVYHPFAYGPDPFYVAFEADSNTGLVPLAIQFIDESSGEDISWEWDFNNDGIIDSYEQNPIFTYPDTGYYDVNLTVTNQYNQYSLVKEDYIYVKDTTTLISSEIFQSINIYPNPVAEELAIEIPKNIFDVNLSIYPDQFIKIRI